MSQCIARVRGIPNIPSITEVNVRTGPGTNFEIAFQAPVGMSGIHILEVQLDSEHKDFNGTVYNWFKLQFHGGAIGWIRDDLLEIEGNCTEWGYLQLDNYTLAQSAKRVMDEEETLSPEIALPSNLSSRISELNRVKKAAFTITSTFEGANYGAYNNYDAGIVSYGLIQFTLSSGSLGSVLEKYLQTSSSPTRHELESFIDLVRARDERLRYDDRFRRLLLEAAHEEAMHQAQEAVATEKYWDVVINLSVTPRNLQYPLTLALLFDIGVNFGTRHGFIGAAEEALGVAPRSRIGENGINEKQLTKIIAELRKESHYKQALRDNLPGLRARGDFWVERVQAEDWGLMGDTQGLIMINGTPIRIRDL